MQIKDKELPILSILITATKKKIRKPNCNEKLQICNYFTVTHTFPTASKHDWSWFPVNVLLFSDPVSL